MRKSQQQKSRPLSNMCTALDNWNAAFQSAQERQSGIESKPEMGFPAYKHSQKELRLGSELFAMGAGAMGKVTKKEVTSAEVQCGSWQEPQGHVQRETQRKPKQCSAVSFRGFSPPRPPSSPAHLSGSTLVDGSTSAHTPCGPAGPYSGSRCHSSCRCRGQTQKHVCLTGEASGGSSSRHPEGNSGCKGAGGRDRYQVAAQTSDCSRQGAHRIVQRQRSTFDLALFMEGVPCRAGLKMGSVFEAVPTTRDPACRPCQSGPTCPWRRPSPILQPPSLFCTRPIRIWISKRRSMSATRKRNRKSPKKLQTPVHRKSRTACNI